MELAFHVKSPDDREEVQNAASVTAEENFGRMYKKVIKVENTAR